jgi:hypothetical protein
MSMSLRVAVILVTLLTLLTTATTASAWGEIFPVKVRGWEHCDSGEANRLTNRTAIPLWVWLYDGNTWYVSTSPGFPDDPFQTFPLIVESIVPFKSNRVAVIGSILFDGAYMTITGYLYNDKRTGGWKSLKGTFVQNGVFYSDCFSSGKVRTGKRTN